MSEKSMTPQKQGKVDGAESKKADVLEEKSVEELQEYLEEFRTKLLDDGVLDEQFTQLQQLQDDSNQDFVKEVVDLFFEDSTKLLDQLSKEVKTEPIDYKQVDAHVHQFKGSSSSVGAHRVTEVCKSFRLCCDKEDAPGCKASLEKVKQEFALFKAKLGELLDIESKIIEKGGTLPMPE
ncbi:histidine-containing phosphotransfer protein [Klebsormidium nitens]|uniref:Histidine-containing phosphotransfer protein n=1 Tax=Klebsormidium nitens TaxID=105231 RepID=A0A1Y1ILH8_KLENI|nr:histidine-containing phosphotransfer protein [Klebsormidium nitens]|eukprot:GAQ89487.1 histidine-containing phosphotransfer protein [Klebsormidium nitens]